MGPLKRLAANGEVEDLSGLCLAIGSGERFRDAEGGDGDLRECRTGDVR
jgi:hypothetical protein